jgi:hypothetical protein
MSKISLRELNHELKRCKIGIDRDTIESTPHLGVYHCHNWNHGYDSWNGIEVNMDGSYVQNFAYKGPRRQFYADLREMISFLVEYIEYASITEFIVAPCYRYSQFTYVARKNDIYEETYSFLRSHNIRIGERSGIRLPYNGNINIIEMVVEGAFRDISELCLLFPSRVVLLVPTHHFGVAFWTQEFEREREVVNDLLLKYPNLRYYDMYSKS